MAWGGQGSFSWFGWKMSKATSWKLHDLTGSRDLAVWSQARTNAPALLVVDDLSAHHPRLKDAVEAAVDALEQHQPSKVVQSAH